MDGATYEQAKELVEKIELLHIKSEELLEKYQSMVHNKEVLDEMQDFKAIQRTIFYAVITDKSARADVLDEAAKRNDTEVHAILRGGN